MAKRIEVEIVGDSKSLSNAFKKMGGEASGFGSKLASVGRVAGIALAAGLAGAGVALHKVIGDASDLNEQMNKTQVVFGKNGKEVIQWSKGLTSSFGISSEAALEAAGTFGNMLVPMGFARPAAADMSKSMVQLAGDMSSFNNASPTDTLEAIRAGIAGEAEPLRKFGVFLSDARLKAEAMSQGLYKGKGVLDAHAKAMATLALITKDTGDAQGDFAKTNTGLANAQRVVAASIDNISASLGSALLPAVAGATSAFAGFLAKFDEAEGASAKIHVVFDALKSVASSAWDTLKAAYNAIDWGVVWKTVADSISRGITFLMGLPWGTWLSTAANTAWSAMKSAFNAINWGEVGKTIGNALVNALNTLGAAIRSVNWNTVGQALVQGIGIAIKALGTFLAGVNWPAVLESIGRGISAVLKGLGSLVLGIATALGAAILTGIVKGLAALGSLVAGKMKELPAALAVVAAAIPGAALAIGVAVVTGVVRGLANLGSRVTTALGAIAAAISSIVTSVAGWAINIGISLVEGVVSGLASLPGRVAGAIHSGITAGIHAAGGVLKGSGEFMATKHLVGKPLADGVIEGFLLGISELPAKLSDSVRKSLEAGQAAVQAGQAGISDAFGKLGEYASRAFEAKTQAILDKVSARFDKAIAKWQTYANAATPAEKKLAAIDAAESQRTRDAALTQAQAQLVTAQAMDEGVAKAEAVAAAMEAIRQANLANTIADLQSQAEGERAAREAAAAAHIAALEATKARELQNWEERRRQSEESLATQLAQLQKSLQNHPKEHDKIQKQIIALLNSYGVTYKNSGELLGKAFAHGLDNAADDVARSAKNLANIVKRYLALNSPAETGPMSDLNRWWQPLGPMLASQMKTGEIAKGAAQMAASAYGKPRLGNPAYGTYAGMSPSIAGMGSTTTGGTVVNVHMPNYLGSIKEVTQALRTELQRTQSRNR